MEIKHRRGEKDAVHQVERAAHAGKDAARVLRAAETLHERLREISDLPHYPDEEPEHDQMPPVEGKRQVGAERERNEHADRETPDEALDGLLRADVRDKLTAADQRADQIPPDVPRLSDGHQKGDPDGTAFEEADLHEE